jgi:hypothetical protein
MSCVTVWSQKEEAEKAKKGSASEHRMGIKPKPITLQVELRNLLVGLKQKHKVIQTQAQFQINSQILKIFLMFI